jgi:proline-specific peptidase
MTEQEGYLDVPGGRVWYRCVGEQKNDRAPLLCLHGGPGFTHYYLEPLESLADRRQVVFYDQLGCGRSERPDDPSLWTVDRFVEEVAQVRAALSLGRLHLFGSSWGGMLAMQYVLDRQPDLESLTLCGSPASMIRWVADCEELLAAEPPETRKVIREHEHAGTTSAPRATWPPCASASAAPSCGSSRTPRTCASPNSPLNSPGSSILFLT